MVGKKWLGLVKSLHQKKYRNLHQLFFIEGTKAVKELINAGCIPERIFTYKELEQHFPLPEKEIISEKELKKISALQHPNGVLGVFHIPKPKPVSHQHWILALDTVRDPGNLGTIIRLCDWFDISHLVCSETTVDCYNPKVLQATMGSIARVNVVYENLESFFQTTALPVYGAFMDGEAVYDQELPESGVLLLGNEGSGISPSLFLHVQKKIAIPQFGSTTAESLNVAMATGILLNEIKRKSFSG